MMLFSDLLREINPEWHGAFVRFVETGEASEEFLDYLDSDETCQRMMETALIERLKIVEPYVAALRAAPVPSADEARAEIARAIERTAMLPAEERTQVLNQVAQDLKDKLETETTKPRLRARAAGAGGPTSARP